MKRLEHIRIDFETAAAFVSAHHRHHTPPAGHLFSIGGMRGGELVGVVIVGRPVSRHRDDGLTAEVTRLCVLPDEPKVVDRAGAVHAPAACSFLYGRARAAAFALGFKEIGTYTLAEEPGASLKGAGWRCLGVIKGGTWSRPSRIRTDKHPIGDKLLWERSA